MNSKHTIKRILRESTENNNITRIAVFDFDGTLVNSPLPDEGRKEYETITGQKWPHKGWWGRAESLDTNIFDIKPIQSVLSAYKKEKSIPNTLVIMMTGRIQALSKQVESILSKYGFKFDEYHYNNGGSTLNYKKDTLDDLVNRYPNVKSMILFDDRLEHVEPFKQWGSGLKDIDFDVIHVESNE